jgi:hypothetical protein
MRIAFLYELASLITSTKIKFPSGKRDLNDTVRGHIHIHVATPNNAEHYIVNNQEQYGQQNIVQGPVV